VNGFPVLIELISGQINRHPIAMHEVGSETVHVEHRDTSLIRNNQSLQDNHRTLGKGPL